MKDKNKIIVNPYQSPCGVLLLGSIGDKLCLCDWRTEKHSARVDNRLKRMWNAEFEEGTSAVIESARQQLDEYFAGKRQTFDIPLLFIGTDFQKTVWSELLKIPFGTSVSYGEVARRIGRPAAVRAVANANGANPMSIFVPCHRVIGSDRSLTGYGGGLGSKQSSRLPRIAGLDWSPLIVFLIVNALLYWVTPLSQGYFVSAWF